MFVDTIQPVIKPVVLSNRLYNRFDNRLYRVNGVSVNLSVNTCYCAACVRMLLLYTAHSRYSLIESSEVFLDEAPHEILPLTFGRPDSCSAVQTADFNALKSRQSDK